MPKLSIIKNIKKGKNVQIYNFVNLYGCQIGDNTKIGAYVEIQKGAKIGKNCKISSHSFICEGVKIQDNVFIGHHVVFTNDRYPSAVSKTGKPKLISDWKLEKTIVEKNASIGSNATILPGLIIGENSLIGAGSVVTKNILKNVIVAGNPAKIIKKLK